MFGATRITLALALGGALLVSAAAWSGTHPIPRRDSLVAQDSLSATVRDVREGGIEVITGVQFALKLTYIVVDSATVIRRQGVTVDVRALEPGDLVIVRFRETERGRVAESIVVQPPQGRGAG